MGSCLSIAQEVATAAAAAAAEQANENDGGQTQQQQNHQTEEQHQTPSSSSGGSSPVYSSLPNGCQKYAVRNVYDGDTLTLIDGETRVRLIGVDTPEMKPTPQPYAEEAKEYTKSKCNKQDIWLLETGKDHYGRSLGFVFVEEESSYVCINEGLVQQGYAYAYIPNSNEKPFNWDKMLKLQQDAKSAKRGLWKTFQDITVVKTANGSAYHQRSCEHVQGSRLTELKVSEAADMGLHPCRTCMAD
jgi:endonuclease YncB( thermonuclease family)